MDSFVNSKEFILRYKNGGNLCLSKDYLHFYIFIMFYIEKYKHMCGDRLRKANLQSKLGGTKLGTAKGRKS